MFFQENLQDQAIMNLLFLGNDQTPLPHNNFLNPQYNILNDSTYAIKANTMMLRTQKNSQNKQKVKTQTQAHSLQHIANNTKNKQNLKKILKKLENSPSPTKRPKHKKKQFDIIHLKTLNSEPHSQTKCCCQKTPELTNKSLKKLFAKDKNKDFIRNLIKAKIVQKLRSGDSKKIERLSKHQNYPTEKTNKISTLRQMNGQIMKKSIGSILKTQKSKQIVNYYNLLKQERTVNRTSQSRKNSRIHLKQLLF